MYDPLLLQELSDQTGGDFDNNDVRWVITVPAIWKMPAKQFMREAAYKVDQEASTHICTLTLLLTTHLVSWLTTDSMAEDRAGNDGG